MTQAPRVGGPSTERDDSLAPWSVDRSVLAALPVGVVVHSGDGRIMSCNSAAERILGLSESQMMGLTSVDPLWRAVHEDETPFPGEAHPAMVTLRTGEPVTDVVMGVHKSDGTLAWILVNSEPIAGIASPSAPAVVATFSDISERVRLRKHLQAVLDTMLDYHALLSAVRDDGGTVVDFVLDDVNDVTCERLNESQSDLVGASISHLFPGAAGRQCRHWCELVLGTGQPLRVDDQHLDTALLAAPGWFDVRAVRVGDQVSLIWRDVTDRHEAVQSLTESEDRYRLLAENASDVVFMAGSDRRIVWIAPSVTAALGWDPEELVGTQLADLFRPDYKIASAQDRVELYTKGHDVDAEGGFLFELRTKSGDYRWMSGHEHALTDPDGTPAGVVAGLRDVNELVKAREETQGLSDALQASNESLRDFVAVASHDLRSPLVTIGGFTKILTDNWATLSDEARLKQLAAIKRGVDRLSTLTNDLLTSAKVEGEADQPRTEHIRLSTAIDSYLEANRDKLGAVGVTCPPELVAVVDPSHLTRILDNYLTNAVKYGEPPIAVEAERVGDFVELLVRDHGPGVPPELVPRLFTKFDRGVTPTTRATQGTGLGLSIVKALAEANHGEVSYQQDEPNGGCFVVRLPAAAA